MPSNELPRDMIADILSRLPVSCLNKLKLVSKSFKSLITSPSFITLKLDRSSKQRILTSTTAGFTLLDTSSFDQTHIDFQTKTKNYCVNIIGSCRGLVAFALKLDEGFYLWNPWTGEYKKLADPCFQSSPWHGPFPSFTGLGYDPSTNDYKVVYGVEEFENRSTIHKVFIFSWRNNSWKMIESPRIEPMGICHEQSWQGCCVNGALHWLSFSADGRLPQIMAWDLKTEKFSTIPLSPNFGLPRSPRIPSSIAVVDGRLFLTCYTRILGYLNYSVEIWEMREYGVRESWVHLCCLPESMRYFYQPFLLFKNHHMMVRYGNGNGNMEFLRFDLKTGTLVDKCNINCCQVILVTDSLFSPNVEHHQQQQIKGNRKRKER